MTAATTSRTTRTGVVRVMVVDDHPVVRDGVALLLRSDAGFRVVGGADTGRSAVAGVTDIDPDVVLLDLRLPDLGAPEVVRGILARCPGVRVVVFTAHGERHAVRAALDAGAHGCLLKDAGTTDLVAALRAVLRGERVVDPRADTAAPAAGRPELTRREYEVLRLAAQGNTNPEIAAATGLARNTVKTYLQSTLQKLGARNRVEAIGIASEAGLL